MIKFIVRRKTHEEFEQMLKIHYWCEEAFGRVDYVRWNCGFADDSEHYVYYSFSKREDASAFVFQWDQYCLSDEQKFHEGLLSWYDIEANRRALEESNAK
jgi:hypothetical protein